jgi:hypothetical protein
MYSNRNPASTNDLLAPQSGMWVNNWNYRGPTKYAKKIFPVFREDKTNTKPVRGMKVVKATEARERTNDRSEIESLRATVERMMEIVTEREGGASEKRGGKRGRVNRVVNVGHENRGVDERDEEMTVVFV